MRQLCVLYQKLKKSESYFLTVLFRFLLFKLLYKKSVLLHQNVTIKGVRNIESNDLIQVGIDYVGFMHKTDKSFLNINGKLKFNGKYSIGRGCRFDIGKMQL